jgi:NADH-quinone oxidoreductase subunit L
MDFFLGKIGFIPLFPLATAGLMLLIGRRLQKAAVGGLCVGSVALSFIFSVGAVYELVQRDPAQRVVQSVFFQWVPAIDYHTAGGKLASFVADWGFLLDPLSAVMILVVSGVGLLIHIYSIGYMGHEGGYYRFFGYMNLFMFSMLTLVLANNLLLMFVGWEGVGTCSYLLIGFYFLKKSASDAGKKAFIVNRVGDAGFLLGIFLISALLGTITFTGVNHPDGMLGMRETLGSALQSGALAVGAPVLTLIGLLLFVGATGKSAQIPLYTWLPDAMEGPTPVSALIHAATMVTAGVYMLARNNFLYEAAPRALEVVAIIGALTAVFAATMGVLQNDIKRVLAYSTISQLGYMFLACGVGAYAAGIFHLMTHAYFKALLFLGSGSVIHALSGEQDMRRMGALFRKIPLTAWTFLIGTLTIAGLPGFAAFFSKDEILWKAWSSERGVDLGHALWYVGVITAGLTAFYMFRLFFMTFAGKSRVPLEVEHHIHESPRSMTVVLLALALLSIVGGWVGIPASLGGSNHFEHFLEPVMAPLAGATVTHSAEVAGSPAAEAHHDTTEYALMFGSVALAALGVFLAYTIYLKREGLAERMAASWPRLHRLVYRKYYMDEIYDALFVNRTKDLGTVLGAFDRGIIDGLGVNGSAWLTRVTSVISIWWDTWIVDGSVRLTGALARAFSYPVRLAQAGLVQFYALSIVIGVLLLLGYTLFWGVK